MQNLSKVFYTIQEAIEWIAFRKESTEVTAEYAISHQQDLNKAQQLLLKSILLHKIRLFGQIDGKSRYSGMELFLNPELGNYLEPEQEIIAFSDNTLIYPEENSLVIGDIIYRHVRICIDTLKQQFPLVTTHPVKEIKGYITPYMEIMFETIREEGLSIENQSKKDVLTDIIAKKMVDRGLKESANLANAMATLIRMPESQNGRLRKG